MSSTNATELERTLLRSGDDIYRLALLLCADESSAAQALIKAIRRLATSGTAPDQPALLAALLAVLPARAPALASAPPACLGAVARCPGRAGRAACGAGCVAAQAAVRAGPDNAALVRVGRCRCAAWRRRSRRPRWCRRNPVWQRDPEHAEAAQTRAVVRDTLLALAPIAIPTISPAALDSADVPEACRPTRTAIALNDPALHNDATIRGHLALCSACRAAEHAWQSLSITVEEALRGALRDTRLPPALADQLQVASQPAPAVGWALLANPRARLALVALPVLALIAFLVWPRGVPQTPTASAPALAQAPAARDLVQRAHDQLYIPPAGQGTWHGRYQCSGRLPMIRLRCWPAMSGSIQPADGTAFSWCIIAAAAPTSSSWPMASAAPAMQSAGTISRRSTR